MTFLVAALCVWLDAILGRKPATGSRSIIGGNAAQDRNPGGVPQCRNGAHCARNLTS